MIVIMSLSIITSNNIFYAEAKNEKFKELPIVNDRNLEVQVYAHGFKFTTGMAFLGANDLLLIEKNTGRVIHVHNGTKVDTIFDANVANTSERGLLGIAISDASNIPRYVFLFYTESEGRDGGRPLGNRLYRYEFVDDKLINPVLLLDLPLLPGPSHDGGVLKIGPDNKSVYLVIGNLNYAQNETYITRTQNEKLGPPPDGRGGILRVTFDGGVINGKGILGEGHPLDKYFAYGLRNSFGIGFDPLTGNLWDTENGQSTHDEINLVLPGFNSGWRHIQGLSTLDSSFNKDDLEDFGGNGVYRDPEFEWLKTVAPTSILFFNSGTLGNKYRDSMFVGSVDNGTIYNFNLDPTRTHLVLSGALADKVANSQEELKDIIFGINFGIITGLEKGQDQNLYVLTNYKHDGTIFKIVPIKRS